jgi:hypothetical protein
MHIVAEYKEDTKEIFRVSVWAEIPHGAKNFLDITEMEGSSGSVAHLIGKYVINDQITDAVTQVVDSQITDSVTTSAPVEEAPAAPAEEETDE